MTPTRRQEEGRVRAGLEAAAVRARLADVAWRLNRGRLAVLAYHAVTDADRFAAQVSFLRRSHALVSLDQVARAQRGDEELPGGAVLITFDDGHRSIRDVALPILSGEQVPAVAFVVTGLIDTDQPPWWIEAADRATAAGDDPAAFVRRLKQVPDRDRVDALEQLRAGGGQVAPHPNLTAADLTALEAGGVAIGNHSVSHPCLDRCTTDVIDDEIGRAHRQLTDWLGHAPTAIAYPNGNEDPRVVASARAQGYELGFLFDHRLAPVPSVDPLRMSRIRVDASAGLDRFRLAVSGVHPLVHRLRGGA